MTIDKPEPKLNPEGYENTFVNTKKPLPDLSNGFSDFDPDPNNSNLDTKQRRRLLERAEWEAFWKIPDTLPSIFGCIWWTDQLVGSARRVWSRSTKNINARITI